MPDSIQGIFVLLVALLPGALYIWSFEREVGAWGLAATDRVLRFLGVSAVLQALLAPLVFWIWSSLFFDLRGRPWSESLHEVIVNEGHWWIFLTPLLYFGLPLALGFLGAAAVIRARKGELGVWPKLARVLAGRVPAPRAWDYLFSSRQPAIIRVEMTTGERIGGIFGPYSYASGYPEEPQDLYLEQGLVVDQQTGEFVVDDSGEYEELGAGLMVRWENVKVLEFFEAQPEETDEGE